MLKENGRTQNGKRPRRTDGQSDMQKQLRCPKIMDINGKGTLKRLENPSFRYKDDVRQDSDAR